MAENNDKGKLLENIVASLHSDKNLKVETRVWLKPLNEINGESREIDVLITTEIAGYHKIYIPIECKNYARQINPSDINAFSGKLYELGLSTNNAIFVSVNGYSPKSKKSARKVGIKLLTVQGLTKDRLSKSIYKAIQSVVYLLPIFNKYKVITSIPNVSNNEHLFFFDKDKNYKGSIADIIYNLWKNEEIPLVLGDCEFTVNVPNDWYNLYENELHACFSIQVKIILIGYVVNYYGNANHISLIDEENKVINKSQINLDFNNCNEYTIRTLKSEDELNTLLNSRAESYRLDIERTKLLKVGLNGLFYPLSKKVKDEFENFILDSRRSKSEIESFIQKMQDQEKDFFSILE